MPRTMSTTGGISCVTICHIAYSFDREGLFVFAARVQSFLRCSKASNKALYLSDI